MAAETTWPLVGAAFCFVIALISLLAMQRSRLFLAPLIAAVVVYILVIADNVSNGDGAAIGLLVANIVILALTLLMLPFLARKGNEAEEPEAAPEPIRFQATVRTEPAQPSVFYYDYKGDVHDVIDVEGIGPVYAERLKRVGVETTARLCYEDADALAARIDVPVKTIRSWQAMSELAKVNGIGKQYAEALVRSGVSGVEELKKRDAKAIAEQVNGYLAGLETNVLGQPVTPRRVTGWKTKAQPMRRVRQTVPVA